jgi:hypothetical protein
MKNVAKASKLKVGTLTPIEESLFWEIARATDVSIKEVGVTETSDYLKLQYWNTGNELYLAFAYKIDGREH